LLFRSPARGTRKPVVDDKTRTSAKFEFPSMEVAEFFVQKLVTVFEDDGFFVHRLSRQEGLYQLRKDYTVIDFHQSAAELTFSCDHKTVPLVNAAMFETVAELEQAFCELRKPLDSQSIRTRLLEAGPLGPHTLRLKDYLTPRLIQPSLEGSTKAEVIDELLELLAESGLLHDVETARQAVWQREESMSTGLQYGVAIPHGKTDAVDRLVCAIGLKKQGVDFNAMDGQPSEIIILTLSPKTKPAPHVQFMSTVSQILTRSGRQRILQCKTRRQLYKAFTSPVLQQPEDAISAE